MLRGWTLWMSVERRVCFCRDTEVLYISNKQPLEKHESMDSNSAASSSKAPSMQLTKPHISYEGINPRASFAGDPLPLNFQKKKNYAVKKKTCVGRKQHGRKRKTLSGVKPSPLRHPHDIPNRRAPIKTCFPPINQSRLC